jgi:hypothetical protein
MVRGFGAGHFQYADLRKTNPPIDAGISDIALVELFKSKCPSS